MLLSLLALLLPVPPFLAGLPLPPVLVDPVERVDAPPLPPPPPQADRIAALMAVKMMVLILVLIADILFPFLVIRMAHFYRMA